jgi:hypothetical protein
MVTGPDAARRHVDFAWIGLGIGDVWAGSDLNAGELQTFARMFQTAVAGPRWMGAGVSRPKSLL